MLRLRLVVVLQCMAIASTALAADDWWGRDKALHLSVSMGLGAAAYGGLWLMGDDLPEVKLALSWSLAMLPGVAKEIHDDGQRGNRFSGKDLMWNAIGALVGSGVLYAVERLFFRGNGVGRKHTFRYWGARSFSRACCPGTALPD